VSFKERESKEPVFPAETGTRKGRKTGHYNNEMPGFPIHFDGTQKPRKPGATWERRARYIVPLQKQEENPPRMTAFQLKRA
jgi:hypothetical protein